MQLAIMTFNALPSCAIMLALIAGTSQGVKAGTTAYVGGGLLSGTVESCIKAMKTAADKTGFTESQETLMSDDKKTGDFHADSKDSPLHFTASCDPMSGVWTVGVSGIDNTKTLEAYNQVIEALP